MAQNNQYRRLPGKGLVSETFFTVVGTKSRLYIGNDHLLRVNSNGWTEKYRRFYFSDIQGIVVSMNNLRNIWTMLHLIICALFLLWLLVVENTIGRSILAGLATFFAVMFLVNLLRGPSCLTRIQTRTGTEPLPSLQRLRNARRVIQMLQPYLEAAQGGLTAEEIPQRAAEFVSGMESVAQSALAPLAAMPAPAPSSRANSYRGALHGWMFAAFLLEAVAFAMNIAYHGPMPALLIPAAFLPATVLTILSLVKQSGSALGRGVKTATWIGLAHIAIGFICGYAVVISTMVEQPKLLRDDGNIFIAVAEAHSPFIQNTYFFLGAFAMVAALTGFITLLGSRAGMAAIESSSQS